jgi:hypothetical protein
VPYVVGLCRKGTPQASQAGSCSMPRPIVHYGFVIQRINALKKTALCTVTESLQNATFRFLFI